MIRVFLFILSFVWFSFFGEVHSVSALTTYIPGSSIALSGSNDSVYFDVAGDIYTAGTSVEGPHLITATRIFSGAFYLSGAGWVDFSTGSYSVRLDCGVQSLGALSTPCVLRGTGYSENIGDVVFDGRVEYSPVTSLLTGTAATYAGEYFLDRITLPLRPASFIGGALTPANHQANMTLTGLTLYSGIGTWGLHFMPIGGTDRAYTLGTDVDVSHASTYRVELIDPDGGQTIIDDFIVSNDVPSTTLDGALAFTVRQSYCTTSPASCPDGSTLSASRLIRIPPLTSVAANGVDKYDFTLKLRDKYGNRVTTGTTKVEYRDTIRTLQIDPSIYMNAITESCIFGTCALITTGLINGSDGKPSTLVLSNNLGDITYAIVSRAPTSPSDTLSLSGILYTDTLGTVTDIAPNSWKNPLTFTPWYSTSLSVGALTVGEDVAFTTSYTHTTLAPLPTSPSALYDIRIGNHVFASFEDFRSVNPISCAKYVSQMGVGACDWFTSPDPVIVSTEALSFTGRYGYYGYEPPVETVSYSSYIRYNLGGIYVVYPSTASSLGTATPAMTRMKILGQQNLSSISGINITNKAEIYNTLRKKITLLDRNRSSYTDVDYGVTVGDVTINGASFNAGSIKKRTIIALGGDITLTHDVSRKNFPLALIALSDTSGNGGNIHINQTVRNIHASLIAEKSVFSTGSSQLYIEGSVISRNSSSNTKCPYYISPCVNPKQYNLEHLRSDFLTTPGPLASYLSGKYPTIPLVIQYDGRIITDPPPGLTQ